MNKSLALAFGALLIASAALAQEEPVLNVYNWSDYIAEDTIANFEAKTGIKVNVTNEARPLIDKAALLQVLSPQTISAPPSDASERAGFYGYGMNVGDKGGLAAWPDSAAAMKSANRRSTSCWWKWTASTPTRA